MKALSFALLLTALMVCPVMGQSPRFVEQTLKARRDCEKALRNADSAYRMYESLGQRTRGKAVREFLRSEGLDRYRLDMDDARAQEAERQRSDQTLAPLSDGRKAATSGQRGSVSRTTPRRVEPRDREPKVKESFSDCRVWREREHPVV